MKSRSRIIVAFLLCACLIVGVGYANVLEQLKVVGTLEFTPSSETGLEDEVYFTGQKAFVNKDHASVETDAFIVNIEEQRVNLQAQFTSANIGDFTDTNQYTGGIILEIAVVNNGLENLTIKFGDIAESGTATIQSEFSITTTLKDGSTAGATPVTLNQNITVEPGIENAKYYWLHVQFTLPKSVVDSSTTISPADFDIVLPVTKVETP